MTRAMPIGAQGIRQWLGGDRRLVGQHGIEAALHVEPMIGIADRRIELRQFLGMRR